MSGSYEDYEKDYNAYLSRIRSFLAGTRSRSTLTECERLLGEAKSCATAMQGLAECEGNAMRVTEAQQRLERDLAPLQKEVQRALNEMGRQDLFSNTTGSGGGYQAPDLESGGPAATPITNRPEDMDSLIASSEDLLRESQSILAETEEVGTRTLHQMGRQREQLHNTNANLQAIQNVATQAKNILRSMSLRAWRNKCALYAMILFLLALDIFVMYRIYKKKHKSAEDEGGDE